MIKRKNGKNAFTLTELIVVIVIIGILAAVLIPTIAGYIEKARLSSDTSDVKNMNQVLNIDAIFDDVAYYDVDYVEQKLLENGYDLKTKAKGYSYWYDRATNCIVLEKTSSVLSDAVSADTVNGFKQNTIEALSSKHPSYLYVGKNNNALTNLVEGVRNLVEISTSNASTKADIVKNMKTKFAELKEKTVLEYKNLTEYLEKYSPDNALYVTDDGYYTSNSKKEITSLVFSKQITTIAPLEADVTINVGTIDIPNSVVYVQEGAFTLKVANGTVINTTSNVVFEEGSYVPGTVQIQTVETITVEDYIVTYPKKDQIASSGKVTRVEATTVTEDLRCEYLVPTVNIQNSAIPFGSLTSCVVRSTIENGYVKMTLAALTSDNKKYKLDNIGYITNIDASTITFAKAKYNTETKKHEIVVTVVVSTNIPDEILNFKNFKNAKVAVEYTPINMPYIISTNDNGNVIVKTDGDVTNGEKIVKEITLSEFVANKGNLYETLKVSEYNSLQINSIKIIVGETVLFIQYYN